MDLDHHNENKLSEHFVYQYMIKSYDHTLQDLIYFWMCYKHALELKSLTSMQIMKNPI